MCIDFILEWHLHCFQSLCDVILKTSLMYSADISVVIMSFFDKSGPGHNWNELDSWRPSNTFWRDRWPWHVAHKPKHPGVHRIKRGDSSEALLYFSSLHLCRISKLLWCTGWCRKLKLSTLFEAAEGAAASSPWKAQQKTKTQERKKSERENHQTEWTGRERHCTEALSFSYSEAEEGSTKYRCWVQSIQRWKGTDYIDWCCWNGVTVLHWVKSLAYNPVCAVKHRHTH